MRKKIKAGFNAKAISNAIGPKRVGLSLLFGLVATVATTWPSLKTAGSLATDIQKQPFRTNLDTKDWPIDISQGHQNEWSNFQNYIDQHRPGSATSTNIVNGDTFILTTWKRKSFWYDMRLLDTLFWRDGHHKKHRSAKFQRDGKLVDELAIEFLSFEMGRPLRFAEHDIRLNPESPFPMADGTGLPNPPHNVHPILSDIIFESDGIPLTGHSATQRNIENERFFPSPLQWRLKETALNVIIWATPFYICLLIPSLAKNQWRKLKGHCASCGYDLSNSPGACPECGAPPRRSDATRSTPAPETQTLDANRGPAP